MRRINAALRQTQVHEGFHQTLFARQLIPALLGFTHTVAQLRDIEQCGLLLLGARELAFHRPRTVRVAEHHRCVWREFSRSARKCVVQTGRRRYCDILLRRLGRLRRSLHCGARYRRCLELFVLRSVLRLVFRAFFQLQRLAGLLFGCVSHLSTFLILPVLPTIKPTPFILRNPCFDFPVLKSPIKTMTTKRTRNICLTLYIVNYSSTISYQTYVVN